MFVTTFSFITHVIKIISNKSQDSLIHIWIIQSRFFFLTPYNGSFQNSVTSIHWEIELQWLSNNFTEKAFPVTSITLFGLLGIYPYLQVLNLNLKSHFKYSRTFKSKGENEYHWTTKKAKEPKLEKAKWRVGNTREK